MKLSKLDKKIIKEVREQYRSKTDLQRRSRKLYRRLYRWGWLGIVFKERIPKGYWTFEKCKSDALKYKTKNEWYKKSSSAYNAAKRYGWFSLCTSHMTPYRTKHTLETCKKSAKLYNNRTAWIKGDKNSYSFARNRGWLDLCCSHMVTLHVQGKWTSELLIEDALKYKTKNEWRLNSGGAWKAARRLGIFELCIAHMTNNLRAHTLESCKVEALKYKTSGAWYKGDKKSYQAAQKRGWLNTCTSHMEKPIRYTFEHIQKTALPFKTKRDWKRNCPFEFSVAKKNSWVKESCSHMEQQEKSPRLENREKVSRTLSECKVAASHYKTRGEWKKKDIKTYRYAMKKGWLVECSKHMTYVEKRKKVACLQTGEIFISITEASKKYPRIRDVLKGKQKSTGGFSFTYVKEYINKDVDKD